MNTHYDELERQIASLLSRATALLPESSFEEAQDYLEHNEFALALDTIAAILKNGGLHIDAESYHEFVTLGQQLGFGEDAWKAIRPIV